MTVSRVLASWLVPDAPRRQRAEVAGAPSIFFRRAMGGCLSSTEPSPLRASTAASWTCPSRPTPLEGTRVFVGVEASFGKSRCRLCGRLLGLPRRRTRRSLPRPELRLSHMRGARRPPFVLDSVAVALHPPMVAFVLCLSSRAPGCPRSSSTPTRNAAAPRHAVGQGP